MNLIAVFQKSCLFTALFIVVFGLQLKCEAQTAGDSDTHSAATSTTKSEESGVRSPGDQQEIPGDIFNAPDDIPKQNAPARSKLTEDSSEQAQNKKPLVDPPFDNSVAKSTAPAKLSGQPAKADGSDTASETSSNDSQMNLGILDLEEHLAASRFNSKPGIEERAILVRAYERIALAVCFPPISFLVKRQGLAEVSPRCRETIEKIASLHSNNSILVCSDKGVDSLECARSFETQTVRKYESGEQSKLVLDEKLQNPLKSPEVNARFAVLQKKLVADFETFKKDPTIAGLKIVDTSLYPVLAIICRDDALALSIQPPPGYNPEGSLRPGDNLSASKSLAISDALDLLKSDGTESLALPSPTVDPEEAARSRVYYRARVLSDQCFDTISDALTVDNRLSSAVCFRDGFISPSCLSALRRFQTLKDPPIGGTPESREVDTSRDGLGTF